MEPLIGEYAIQVPVNEETSFGTSARYATNLSTYDVFSFISASFKNTCYAIRSLILIDVNAISPGLKLCTQIRV